MTPREPDRFDKQARDLCLTKWREIAAALRAEHASALERAAQTVEATYPEESATTETGLMILTQIINAARNVRALIPPAAAPAAEDDTPRCNTFGAMGLPSIAPAAETGKETAPCWSRKCQLPDGHPGLHDPNPQPAPAQGEPDQACRSFQPKWVGRSAICMHCGFDADEHATPAPAQGAEAPDELAAVLRGKDEMGEKLAKALGVPAAPLGRLVDAAVARTQAWAAAIEYCEDGFSPEWLADRRNRSVFAAHIYRLLIAARGAPPEEPPAP